MDQHNYFAPVAATDHQEVTTLAIAIVAHDQVGVGEDFIWVSVDPVEHRALRPAVRALTGAILGVATR